MFTRTTNSARNTSTYFRSFKSPTWPLAKVSRLFVIAFLILTLFFDWFTPAEASNSDAAAPTQAATSPNVAKTTNTQANPTNAFANLPTSVPSAAKTAQVQQNLSKLGLRFEENDGQFDPQVKFKAQGGGYTLWLTSSGAVFDVLTGSTPVTPTTSSKVSPPQSVNHLCQQNSSSGNNSKQPAKILPTKGCPPPPTIDQHVAVRMTLDGANPNLQAIGQNELSGKSNYFIGKDSTKWHTSVPSFGSVSYSNVYPGVDLTYYGNQNGQLEYDFKVAPNADPNAITLNFEGADGVEIASNGDLILHTGKTEIRQPAPQIYQETSDSNGVKSRTAVSGGYISKSSNRVGFKLSGNYDHTKALVIDPLIYSTYLGGTDGFDGLGSSGKSIALDSYGNVYVTGSTYSITFPTTLGAYQTSCTLQSGYNYCATAFISKLNTTGTNLIYSTYLDGSDGNDSESSSIAVDSGGDVYITGNTGSRDFPTTPGAYQTSCIPLLGIALPCDAVFISKLNGTGSNLIYSTYLGGSDHTYSEGYSLVVDNSGNTYVTGWTTSTNFPTTPGAFQTSCSILSGESECSTAFVSKLNGTGSNLIYSTYLGGNDHNSGQGNSIALDSSDDVYIIGWTTSADFPTTPGAFQTSCLVSGQTYCSRVAFISKLNGTGNSLIYSTYLGDSNGDGSDGISITVDSTGDAYATGYTYSANFPTTPGAFQTSCLVNGQSYCALTTFISKLNRTGSNLIYSTYLGGSDGYDSYGQDIAVDNNGNAYVVGFTQSTDFPTTLGALQTSCVQQSGSDECLALVFISKLNAIGNNLAYSSYLGGLEDFNNYVSQGSSIAVDSTGNAYITGYTNNANFPITSGAFQTSCLVSGQSYCDQTTFISKLALIPATNFIQISNPSNSSLQIGQTVSVSAKITDTDSNLIPNIPVSFKVNGANSRNGTINTNTSGTATFTYQGTNVGTDTIIVTAPNITQTIGSNQVQVVWNTVPSNNIHLNVPLLLQYVSPWNNDPYGSSTHQMATDDCGYPKGNTIQRCGCFLTDWAMIVNYYSSISGNSFQTDPRQLNSWLRANNGYSGLEVISNKVAEYAVNVGNIPLFNSSNYNLQESKPDDNKLHNLLASGTPVILEVKNNTHFVLAIGEETLPNGTHTWQINDPGYNHPDLTYYDNIYTLMEWPNLATTPNSIRLQLNSPAELLVTDAEGRKTGYDPNTGISYNEIPDAIYYSETISDPTGTGSSGHTTKIFYSSNPTDEQYSFQVIGTGNGAYSVDVLNIDSNANEISQTVTGQTQIGQINNYNLAYPGTNNGTVTASYTYLLPFLANGAGGYTSYLALQNTGSATANYSLKFYDNAGAVVNTPTLQGICSVLVANAECIPSNPFGSNQTGSGVIVSDQPLNVIVAEATPYGGSAYAVSNGGSNNLVAPLILKGAYGDFNTRLTIFNGGSSAASVAVTFYDQNGNVQTAANQSQAVAANTAWTLDQASSNLPAGFNGWAQISAPSGSQLVAQVLEQSQSRKFVAIANAQPSSKAATTLYAPAIFKGAFGFVTGANIVNPNSNPVSVTVTYYDDNGKAYPAPAFTLNGNSITSIYQSANGGNGLPTNPALPSGFSGAAIISSTGGNLLMVVNESGGVSASGTSLSGVYAAANSGGGTVGLPVMANGGYGYTTGATILNTSNNSVNGTIQYYNPDGTKQGGFHSFTIAPNASQLVYQGDAAQGLSNGFYGTAIVTESGSGQDLIATTNAESGLFYTYTEPNN